MEETVFLNPITEHIKQAIQESKEKIHFASPFLSTFALQILKIENTINIKDKRIITRFDETNIHSFELPTLKKLIELGFSIRFNNSIHLKLYVTDNESYITSSNLTKGGFEDNIELSVKVDSTNHKNCSKIFEDIWSKNINNELTITDIERNWHKYSVLKKRQNYSSKPKKEITITEIVLNEINIENLISGILGQNQDNSWRLKFVFESNKLRSKTIERIHSGFSEEIFYVPADHPKRKDCLFYELSYGPEVKIAGTGLRESHFETVFLHKEFRDVINYLLPETIGLKKWNLSDKEELKEFCNGLFEFNIKCYTQTLPIRLASYFYPDFFLPIFKLEHLEKASKTLGINTNAKSKGDKLYIYNSFLLDKMKHLPFNISIKSEILYQLIFTIELYEKTSKWRNIQSDISRP